MKLISRPPNYVLATILVSFGGLLFGLDTGSIGPITVMPQLADIIGEQSATLHGLIVSMILIPAAIASFFAGHLADKLGRPKGIAVGALGFALGTTIECATVRLAMLLIGRTITGLGQGLFLSTLVVYVCEISPPRHRGALASLPQLLITIGLCMGYFVCYGTVRAGSSLAWRLPFALQSFIAYAFTVASALLLPESPRWLTARGRASEASLAWDRLGVSDTEREKAQEQMSAPDSQTNEISVTQSRRSPLKTKLETLFEVFKGNSRKQTLLGVFLMGMQQLSGIDGVLYYAPLLFQQAGLNSSEASFLASGVSAITIVAVSIPASLLLDAWSRRASTILGALAMTVCMVTIGSLYASDSVHADYGAARWAVVVLIYIFSMTYAASWAVGIKVYTSEIQPPKTRAAASSLAYSSNWIVNWAVAFTTPIFLSRSSFGAYFLFGGATLLTGIICMFFMPETRGQELESIDEAFRSGFHVGQTSDGPGLKKLVGSLVRRFKQRTADRHGSDIELSRR